MIVLNYFKKKKYNIRMGVSKVDTKFHPMKILDKKNGFLKHYHSKGPKIVARQQLDEKYFRNGVCYVINENNFKR